MRHRCSGRLFDRTANQRKALLRGLMSSLLMNGRIETTVAKAKETRKLAERLITLGVKGDLHSRRVALSTLPDGEAVARLFGTIAPRLRGRNGGYLRIVQTRRRVNDGAPMAVLEFVDYEEQRAKRAEGEKEASKNEAKEKKPAPAAGKE